MSSVQQACFALCALLGTACATVELYTSPHVGEEYATIDGEDVHDLLEFGRHSFSIVAIDGKFVPHEVGAPDISVRRVGSEEAIALYPGDRQILVRGCAYKFKALINAGWFCAETVIFLSAESGGEYRLKYEFGDKNRYVTVWVQDKRSKHPVIQPVRVEILERFS